MTATRKTHIRIVCILMLMMVAAVFTMPQETYAASKIGKVKTVKVVSYDYNKARISWSKVNGAKKYQIYRATKKSGKYKKVRTVSSKTRSCINSGLTTGKTYYYKVRAVKGERKGRFSKVKSVKPALKKVTGLAVRMNSDYDISVSWKGVNGAGKYIVYRSTKKDSGYKAVATVGSKSFTDKKYDPGTTQYYKVRAYRSVSGKKIYGSYSNVCSIIPEDATVYITKKEEHTFCKACDEDLTDMTDEERAAHSQLEITVPVTVTKWVCSYDDETFDTEEEAAAHVEAHKAESIDATYAAQERESTETKTHGTDTYTKDVEVKVEHKHDWTPEYKEVEKTTYKIENYSTVICGLCGLEEADVGHDKYYEHASEHIDNGEYNYFDRVEPRQRKVPVTKIEKVLTKYICECGAERSAE